MAKNSLNNLLKESLIKIKTLENDLEKSSNRTNEPIAIVGMSCRFPGGANTIDKFWELLDKGLDSSIEIPSERWNINEYYSPELEAPGKMVSKFCSFIDQPLDMFDADFFSINRREAETLDPQQRLLLEVSWEALEHAGINPQDLRGSATGVFVGISSHDYVDLLDRNTDPEEIDAYFGSGNSASTAAGRVSYTLGLQGPSLAVDTACSSSLVALHLACQSIRLQESELALVAGVNILLSPYLNINFSQAHMLASDGRCKTFDASADGYVRGEGCGVVILKPLSVAQRDGDRIFAVIRGSSVNQDGASSGLTAPNRVAQMKVIRAALADAQLSPADIDYIEAHGTGTQLGDPIEAGALTEVFGDDQGRKQPLIISTVKTNIGHLEAAAGVAGLIKTILALQNQRIPEHLHFKKLNPKINLAAIPAELPLAGRDWITKNEKRRAGISSFGFGGTNAHVIIEEPPTMKKAAPPAEDPPSLLLLSAKNSQALDELRLRYLDFLKDDNLGIEDVCYTSQVGRSRQELMVGVIGRNLQELHKNLDAQIYVSGDDLTALQYDKSIRFNKVSLPNYPFQRQHFWAESLMKKRSPMGVALHPLLGVCLPGIATETGTVFSQKMDWQDPSLRYLSDHVIFDRCVFPASGYIEMLVNALRYAQGNSEEGTILSLHDILIKLPLVWESRTPVTLQTLVDQESTYYQLQVYSNTTNKWNLHVQGKGDLNNPLPVPNEFKLTDIQSRCSESLDVAEFYKKLTAQGLQYGSSFQCVRKLWRSNTEALAKIAIQESDSILSYTFYPPLLDSVFQTLAALAENLIAEKNKQAIYVPVAIEHLLCYESLPKTCYAHVAIDESWLANKEAIHSGTIVAQLHLFTDKGSLIASFKNFTVKRMTTTLFNTLQTSTEEISDSYYEQTWKIYELPAQQIINQETGEISANNQIIYDAGTDLENTANLSSAEKLLDFFKNLFQKTNAKQAITIITRQAYSISDEPIYLNQAALNGLIKTAILEHPDWQIRQVDILAKQDALPLLERLNKSEISEQILAWRDQWYVARVRKEVEVNAARQQLTLPLGDYRLIKNEQGLIESLTLQQVTQVLSPDADEVVLTPRAVGLNFRDVLNAMNLYPGDPGPLGGDCAGVITAVGSQVTDLKIGDEVFGIAYGSLASTAISKASLLVKKPKEISMEDAATIPTVFLTAYYTLIEMANLQKGETVLIHAGSGGVGLASIQLAQWRGACIIVSAGSEEKRKYLRSLGIKDIVDSRHISFSEEVAAITKGRGVDVVLNMLSGEGFVPASVNSCAQGGRFLEIGKRGIWSKEEMAEKRPDIQYTIVALDQMMLDTPDYVHTLFTKVLNLFKKGICKPLPRKTFAITHSIDAFKYLQQARQIGKVVISLPSAQLAFNKQGIYWITGGVGGLGLVVARYLINHGAKHLVLTSRHEESKEAREEINSWRAQGCSVDVILVDVGDKKQLKSVFAKIMKLGTLRGIFHLAGIIEDAPLISQTQESFERVFAGKAQGAWNLHELSQKHGVALDYFVLFSSIASLLGSPGQSNYAAANSFLDGLALYRQQQGLAATSINWGPWAEVGMAKNLVSAHQRQGLSPLTPIQGMVLWEYILKQAPVQCAVIKIDWDKMREAFVQAPSWLQERVEKREASSFVQELRQVPVEQQVAVLKAVIQQELAKVLGIANKEEIDDKKNFMDLGMDSLRSAELINRLQAKIGKAYSLSFSEVAACQNIEDLTKYLSTLLLNAKPTERAATITVSAEDYAKFTRFDTYPGYQQTLAFSQLEENKLLKHLFFESNEGLANNKIKIKRKEYINFSSYNYLGMSGDPEVNKAVMHAVRKYGTSVSASRLVSGQKPIHTELEKEISELLQVPAALVMSAGHATNVNTISHLMGKKDLIIHDSLAHNSLFQGAVFSGAMRLIFSHNNFAELKELLTQYRHQYERVLIITEGVYSMDGDIPNLPELIALKKEFSTFLMVDEAHSMGTIGATGRGISEYFGIDPNDVDIWMGTLSKAFASCGGYIAGSWELVNYLKYTSPGFIYSCGISPPNTASALKSIQLLKQHPERVQQLQANTQFLLEKLQAADVDVGLSKDSPIIPIITRQSTRALQLCEALRKQGVYALPILAPAVEEGKARVRLFVSCQHTKEELSYTADVIIKSVSQLS